MFVRIGNTPRPYAWGSHTALAALLERTPSGGPEAELWLGAHPGSPSTVLDPLRTRGAHTLADWIARDPAATLGDALAEPRLPYLFKILAAQTPLSLQAHPSAAQAREGYAREEAAGIPIDAPTRNYRDGGAKPELVYALSDRFEVLCGFRAPAESRALVEGLIEAGRGAGLEVDALEGLRDELAPAAEPSALLPGVVARLLGGGEEVGRLVAQTVAAAEAAEEDPDPARADAYGTIGYLASVHSGDPGVALSLLLGRHSLRRGEALYLPPGNIHCYLGGLGAEVMLASDNVLRGGLTSKHVDVDELLRVLDFAPHDGLPLEPAVSGDGVTSFRVDAGFGLARVDSLLGGESVVEPEGPAIALVVEGRLEFAGGASRQGLRRGEAAYVTPDEGPLTVTGEGIALVASGRGPQGRGPGR